MPRLMDPFLQELKQETPSTRRLLERVPEEKLDWRPHPKSMTLGELAVHVATIPGRIAAMLRGDHFDMAQATPAPSASSLAGLMSQFEQNLRTAEEVLSDLSDIDAMASWRLHRGDKELLVLPRIAVARAIMLNHWYHHRGQLTVYLRLLDVPLPATYGSSADEKPSVT